MRYFVTGGTGFIGKRVVGALLKNPDNKVYYLSRDLSPDRSKNLFDYWNADQSRAIAIKGDLTESRLGVSEEDLRQLKQRRIDHVFHLAAAYSLDVDRDVAFKTNVGGTRNAVALAAEIGAARFHHISSIAVAGLYDGVFREDMFEEAYGLEHPYYASKHQSEKVIREECTVPWRIYRPGIVVGDSRTGETDKIDGPYYFFKLIQKIRRALPAWMPAIGLEGGRINLVPVDFVVSALLHIAHAKDCDRRCFHLTDPNPQRIGDVFNIFADAAHAPHFAMRVNAALFNLLPRPVVQSLFALTPVRRIYRTLMKDLGLPQSIFTFLNYPTRFDSREADRLLKPAGIKVPPIESYAWRLWDYWERHLDPDLYVDRSLAARVKDRVVVVTGGSSGIGKATALRVAAAGATTIIAARDEGRLEAAKVEAESMGLKFITYRTDLTNEAECSAFVNTLVTKHGGVDILINNAGRSIRRAIEHSYDRFHDFERTMATNYFGALRLTLGLLPEMSKKKRGHVINISSIGVLANAPHFSAYVASKAALEAWTRCAASEYLDRDVQFTTINMPLTRTPMIAPTKLYDNVPTLTPEQAADLVVEAITRRPIRLATPLGIFGQVVHAVAPHMAQVINNMTFRMFPDSSAALGKESKSEPTADQVALTQLLSGIHF